MLLWNVMPVPFGEDFAGSLSFYRLAARSVTQHRQKRFHMMALRDDLALLVPDCVQLSARG